MNLYVLTTTAPGANYDENEYYNNSTGTNPLGSYTADNNAAGPGGLIAST